MSHSQLTSPLNEHFVSEAQSLRALNALPLVPDGVIEHADGTLELDGYIFSVDWDAVDPPEGHPDAGEIPHEQVMAEICELMGLPPGSL